MTSSASGRTDSLNSAPDPTMGPGYFCVLDQRVAAAPP